MIYKGSIVKGSGGGSGDAVWGSITGTLSDQTDLADALAGKQDTLTAGSNITINNNIISATDTTYSAFTGATGSVAGSAGLVPAPATTDNDKYLKGDGTWAEAGGSVSFDGSTINENASNELQAIGVIDKNSGSALGFWHGTQAQYNVGGEVKDTYYDWSYVIDSWSAVSLGDTSYKNDIVYGNNIYVMAGYNVYNSTDGQIWTQIQTVSSGGYRACYGSGKFVLLLKQSTTGYYSVDGENWTAVTIPQENSQWNDIIYVDELNIFVAIAASGKIIYSTNGGASWTESTDSVSYSLNSIAFGNGKFIIAPESYQNSALVSTDGMSWAESSMPTGYSVIAFGNGKFVGVAGGNTQIVYSSDGNTWTTQELPAWYYANKKIVFGGGVFVIYSNQTNSYLYSTDGVNFAQSSSSSIVSNVRFIDYANNMFFAVNNNGGYEAYGTITVNSVYTLDENPTTSSQVYDAPDVASTLTITAVGTGTITLSDTNTYTYNAGGNTYSYYSVGESYPNYVCNIDGVGVKIGDNDVANLASYSAFTGATGSVAGSAGLVPAPATTDNDKYLKGDGTWATVSGGSGIQNTATGTDSLTILGTPTNAITAINIGDSSSVATTDGIAIGVHATSYGGQSIAIGSGYDGSEAVAYSGGVAIGSNTLAGNSNSSNPSVAILGYAPDNAVAILGNANDNEFTVSNYLLMDLSTGKIPNDRISGATGSFTSQDGKTVTVTNGVITSIV